MFSFYPDTYFFTATINSWQPLLEREERKQVLIESLKFLCTTKRILLHGFVIMPNHFHLVLTLGEDETTSKIQTSILQFTSRQIIRQLIAKNELIELMNYKSTQRDRIYHIWERRAFWKHLENTRIVEQKLNYVHQNPLTEKWALCESIENYPWSSASYYLRGDQRFDFLTSFWD
jgi:putative transposase